MQEATKQGIPTPNLETLLVLDVEKKRIQAVKSINEKGKMETIDPISKNHNQFMRIDKGGDFLTNFFLNFFSQFNNPTNYSFFRIPMPLAIKNAMALQRHANKPSPEGEQLVKKYGVKVSRNQEPKNQHNMETTKAVPDEYRFRPEQIDWDMMSKLGLSKEKLEKMNLLDPLLKGYKTNELVPVSLNLGSAITRMDARLSLQSNDDGKVVVAIHGIRKEPNLNFDFFGHRFTEEDKKNILQTGNMGRVVNLTNTKTGENIPSIISVDRLTNELVALRTDKIKLPDEIKGIKLDALQKQMLMEGKPLTLEGMISKKGSEFNATVQFNADKRYVEFLFDKNSPHQVQNSGHRNPINQLPDISQTFRGKVLDNEQFTMFKSGQTVYLSGLIDKRGKEYNGYITLNKETGKTDFSFQSPDKLREAKPVETHKTQLAVNSEGKNNEATRNIKEPLTSGQKSPVSKKEQEPQEAPKASVKSKRIRR